MRNGVSTRAELIWRLENGEALYASTISYPWRYYIGEEGTRVHAGRVKALLGEGKLRLARTRVFRHEYEYIPAPAPGARR